MTSTMLPENGKSKNKWLRIFTSRRFVAAIVSVAAVIFSGSFGVEIDQTRMIEIISWIIGAWIVGDAIRET